MTLKEFWIKCKVNNVFIRDVVECKDGYLVTFKIIYAPGVSGAFITKKIVTKNYEELLELIKKEHPF